MGRCRAVSPRGPEVLGAGVPRPGTIMGPLSLSLVFPVPRELRCHPLCLGPHVFSWKLPVGPSLTLWPGAGSQAVSNMGQAVLAGSPPWLRPVNAALGELGWWQLLVPGACQAEAAGLVLFHSGNLEAGVGCLSRGLVGSGGVRKPPSSRSVSCVPS